MFYSILLISFMDVDSSYSGDQLSFMRIADPRYYLGQAILSQYLAWLESGNSIIGLTRGIQYADLESPDPQQRYDVWRTHLKDSEILARLVDAYRKMGIDKNDSAQLSLIVNQLPFTLNEIIEQQRQLESIWNAYNAQQTREHAMEVYRQHLINQGALVLRDSMAAYFTYILFEWAFRNKL